jgi:hypothetical protein
MPTFKSTNFTKQSVDQSTPMRERTVDDPTEAQSQSSFQSPADINEFAEMERAAKIAKEARREQLSNAERISNPAKQRIELLADIGRLTKEVELAGHVFSLRTLKSKETREAALQSFNVNINTQLEAGYEARRQQLARSIFKIDGHLFEDVIGSNSLETKLQFLDEKLEETIIVKLFDEFSKLKDDARAQFEIKTDTEAKEVAEDLKKL